MAAPVHAYDDTDATLDDFCSDDAGMQACLERARMAARTDLPPKSPAKVKGGGKAGW